MAVQLGSCQSWLETPKTGFLMTRLKWFCLAAASLYYILPCNVVVAVMFLFYLGISDQDCRLITCTLYFDFIKFVAI